MSVRWTLAIAAGCLCVAAVWGADSTTLPGAAAPAAPTAPAAAQPASPAPDSPKITVAFDHTDLAEVVKQLHDKSGLDFVVGAGASGTVTASFTDQPVDKVVKLVARVLGLSAERIDTTWLLKRGTAADTTAAPAAATGAGALLPGDQPTAKLAEPGAPADAVGATATAADGTAVKVGPTTATIPLKNLSAQQAAALLGGGWVDANGVYHSPQQVQAMEQAALQPSATAQGAANPYANLPPDARIGPGGVILLPNGNTVLPNGTVVTAGGTVITPAQPVGAYTVPLGTNLPTNGVYHPQTAQNYGPVMQGSLGGVPFAIAPNGTIGVAPQTIGGAGAQLLLPPLVIGGNQPLATPLPGTNIQFPGGYQLPLGSQLPMGVSNYGTVQQPTFYFGNALPPGMQYTNPGPGQMGFPTVPSGQMSNLPMAPNPVISTTPVGQVVQPTRK